MNNRRFETGVISNESVWSFMRHITEVTLRLPGVLLLELWWRNRDLNVTPEVLQNSPFSSYLEMNKLIQFIQTRNFDQGASVILSYAVVFLFSIFLSLPLKKLLWIYAHFFSMLLLGVAHYMSMRYVRIEQTEDPDLRLDDLKKLEWHGSHIMAQLMLCVAQSCLLGLENDVERVMLSVFLIPILARMCGMSLGHLMLAHNLACSLAMLSVCIYALNRAPKLLNSMRQSYRALRIVIASHGFVEGTVTVWRSLYFGEILSCAWLLIFLSQIYISSTGKVHDIASLTLIVLSATAESTTTPLSLLALALTVRYGCRFVIRFTKWAVGGSYESNHFLLHTGYTEILALVLLCSQTGFLGMPLGQKSFLLGLVLLIVMSSLLRTLYNLLEPRFLELGATSIVSFKRHFRLLILAAVLFSSSVSMALLITNYLPLDLWCVFIVSDSILTAIRTLSLTILYALVVFETQKPEFWESCDDLIFFTKIGTKILELAFAAFVVVYGVYSSFEERWPFVSTLILIFHIYFNIWQQIQLIMSSLNSRRTAVRNLSMLPRASHSVLEKKKDLCAICCEKMCYEARITPCKHFFHGACLKKWLSVKPVCPLCYTAVTFEDEHQIANALETDDSTNYFSLSQANFVGYNEDDSSEWNSDSSSVDFSEYTPVSSDDTDSAN